MKKVGGGVEFREPKTDSGRREVHLSPATLEVLAEHRRRQEHERLSNELWDDQDLIFPNELGRPFHPDNLRRPVERACKRAGLKRIRLHDLRHLNASLMLSSGVDEKVVSERLGHADPSTTRRIYQHTFTEQHLLAAGALDGLLGPRNVEEARPVN